MRNEKNSPDTMNSNCSESEHMNQTNRIKEGKIWEIVETGRENVNNYGVTDRVTDYESTKYSRQKFANTVDHTYGGEWVLVNRYRNGKKRWKYH